jgi:uncharacterized protein involved in tellurium resistance
VTLTRVQTGVGELLLQAVCSPEVGDLRLGCAYALRGGQTSTVQLSGGSRFGPPDGRRPVIGARHAQYEIIGVDLRWCREVERLAVYAFSQSRVPLPWAGTLAVSTFGGAVIDLPIELGRSSRVAMLLTLYNVDGEFVLRREMQPFDTSVRAACLAYGYERITWVDDWTPMGLG